MNLSQGDQGPELAAGISQSAASAADRSQFVQERCTVPLDGCPRIIFRESEIEISFAIGTGESCNARRKSVNQPRKLSQMTRLEDGEFALAADLGWHTSIIKDAPYLSDLGESGNKIILTEEDNDDCYRDIPLVRSV